MYICMYAHNMQVTTDILGASIFLHTYVHTCVSRCICTYIRIYVCTCINRLPRCLYACTYFCSPLTSITPKTKRKYLSLDSGCDHDKTSNATSYILNERLFPVPMHKFEEEGHCPVCEGPNDPDSEKEPTRFIRWGGTVRTCSSVCIHDWNMGEIVL